MGDASTGPTGPDLRQGVPLSSLPDGAMLAGRFDDDAVLLYRAGTEVLAVGATCTHYSTPLAGGIVTDEVIRCPAHHACFSLRTGAAVAAPALNPLSVYRTEVRDGSVFVTARVADDEDSRAASPTHHAHSSRAAPQAFVIVGAGAAGHAAVERLRAEGYDGSITVIDPDADAPYDRPNLSKDYLAGSAPEEWLPLRPREYYAEMNIERIIGAVADIDVAQHTVTLDDARMLPWDRLLLATGAAAVRPRIAGAELPHVFTLRSLADCRALIAAVADARHVVIAGASFIGLEAAAALRERGLEVTVVAPEMVPFERVLGAEAGLFLRALHEDHGVRFHLGHTLARVNPDDVVLDDGTRVPADAVLLATGVRPLVELAERAGLAVDNGVLVDAFLETSSAGVYAAGDIARYPYRGAAPVRIEHWVVAQRMGQTAACNMLGRQRPFADVPFFWTQQYDVPFSYVGHAATWDRLTLDGILHARDCTLRYFAGDELAAVVTVNRGRDSLLAELGFEQSLHANAQPRAPETIQG